MKHTAIYVRGFNSKNKVQVLDSQEASILEYCQKS